MKKLIPIFAVLLLFPFPIAAAHLHPEKVYQAAWCEQAGGIQEVVLDDKTRIDCVTKEHAIEVEFAPKKFEAIGQALYYAARSGKRPGVVLIIESRDELRHLKRLQTVAEKYGITVWMTTPEDLK